MRRTPSPAAMAGPLTVSLLCVALAGAACDADDQGGGADAGVSSGPVGQCQSVLDTVCTRLVECDGDPMRDDATEKSECKTDLGQALPCQRTLTASPQAPQCVADLKALSCAGLFPSSGAALPGSCVGIFEFAPSPAQQECEMLSSVICQRIIACDPTIEVTQQECAEVFSFELDCPFWERTLPAFPACISALQTQTCDMLFPPPEGFLELPTACGGMSTPDPQIDPGGGDGLGI